MKAEKLRLMKELAKAKNFVLLTEKEAVISLPDIDLSNFTDIQLLAAHQSALSRFEIMIKKASRDYERALNRLTSVDRSNGKPSPKKKAKKIIVKQG